jgi:hypothetical protein
MNSNVPMKQQTNLTRFADPSPVVTGLSLKQRHPEGSEAPPFTCPISTDLHSTHSHLRYIFLIAPNPFGLLIRERWA